MTRGQASPQWPRTQVSAAFRTRLLEFSKSEQDTQRERERERERERKEREGRYVASKRE